MLSESYYFFILFLCDIHSPFSSSSSSPLFSGGSGHIFARRSPRHRSRIMRFLIQEQILIRRPTSPQDASGVPSQGSRSIHEWSTPSVDMRAGKRSILPMSKSDAKRHDIGKRSRWYMIRISSTMPTSLRYFGGRRTQ